MIINCGPIVEHEAPTEKLTLSRPKWVQFLRILVIQKCWAMIIQIGDQFVEHEIPPKKLKLTCRKVGRILAVENPPEMLEHDHSKRETTC